MKPIAFALALLAALPLVARAQDSGGKDVFAVVVTRHGVRSSSKPPAQYRWADWQPVAPSFLTARGYSLMTYMGRFYRVYFGSAGIPVSCGGGNVFVYADKDQRTLETGRALIEGMCGKASALPLFHESDLAAEDPLFDATQWAVASHRVDPAASRAAVQAALPVPPDELTKHYAPQFASLQRTLDARCGGECEPAAFGMSAVGPGTEGLSELFGPVKAASTYAEDLFLERAQCRPEAPGDAALSDAMNLHVLAYDVNARNRYNPRVRGGTLFAHIVAMLETKAGRPHPQAVVPADISRDDIVVFSGHDTQLGALGGILDAHWSPGAGIVADDMPPGGALIFELVKSGHDYKVRLRFAYETMNQFAHYKLQPAGTASVPVRFLGCPTDACTVPLEQLSALAGSIAKQGLVRREWTNASSDDVTLDPLENPKWTQCKP